MAGVHSSIAMFPGFLYLYGVKLNFIAMETQKYFVSFSYNGKVFLGYYDNKQDAEAVYKKAVVELEAGRRFVRNG